MPAFEVVFPVGAEKIKPKAPTIDRVSKDGNIPVARIFGGDNFAGEIIESLWMRSGYESNSSSTVALSSGSLSMIGLSTVGGTVRHCHIGNVAPFLMLQNAYIDIHLESHTATPAYDGSIRFFLTLQTPDDYPDTGKYWLPSEDEDYLFVELQRTTAPAYRIRVGKKIDNSETIIYAYTAITNEEGTFRIKFRPDDGVLDIYFHDGAGAIVESTDELTLTDDTLDLRFDVGYPFVMHETADTTNREFKSDGIVTYYPDLLYEYSQPASDVGKGDVKIRDAMGSVTESDWRRVYSEDHDFTGNVIMDNGLVRLTIKEGIENGLQLECWNGSAWVQPYDVIALIGVQWPDWYVYPAFQTILSLTPEKVVLSVLLSSSTAEETEKVTITFDRGKWYFSMQLMGENIKKGDIRATILNIGAFRRFSYLGDSKTLGVADVDMTRTVSNTTLSDNFLIHFDDTSTDGLGFMAINQKPNATLKTFYSAVGYAYIRDIAYSDFEDTVILFGAMPYPDADHLFLEAEDGSTTGTDDVADGTASGGYKVELDAITEEVYYELVPHTDLPKGRYLLVVRMKDSNQVVDDAEIDVSDIFTTYYYNEGNAPIPHTLTASWDHYAIEFQITDADPTSIKFRVTKATATANTIDVDYFLIIPLGDGSSGVMSSAHNFLRSMDKAFRITDTATFDLFAGTGLQYGGLLGSLYTDQDAIAAVEGELTLDLEGVMTIDEIHIDAGGGTSGLYVGQADDMRLYHLSGENFLDVAGDFFLDADGKVSIRDKDDSDVVLFELDTDARTFQIGQSADLIPSTFYGDMTLVGELLLEAATIHSSGEEIHIHPSVGNEDGHLTIHPLGTNVSAHLHLHNAPAPASSGMVVFDITGTVVSIQSSQAGAGVAPTTFNLNDPDWDTINIGDSSAIVNIKGVAYSRYTDAEVESVIDAELVDGESIDIAIDALISTHTAIEAAHGMELDDLTDVSLTGPLLEDSAVYGSGNAAYHPCLFQADSSGAPIEFTSGHITPTHGNDTFWQFLLPLPTLKDGLKLYVTGWRIDVNAGGANDFIDTVYVTRMKYDDDDPIDDSPWDVTINSLSTNSQAFSAAVDCSGYKQVIVQLQIDLQAAGVLRITSVELLCYYAA